MVRALTRRRSLLKFRRFQPASTLASLVTSMAMPITFRSEPFSSFAVAMTPFWLRSMTTLAPPAHEGARDRVANAVRRFRHDRNCIVQVHVASRRIFEGVHPVPGCRVRKEADVGSQICRLDIDRRCDTEHVEMRRQPPIGTLTANLVQVHQKSPVGI